MDLPQDRQRIESNGDLKLNIMALYMKLTWFVATKYIAVYIVLCIAQNAFQYEAQYSTSNPTLVVFVQTQRM